MSWDRFPPPFSRSGWEISPCAKIFDFLELELFLGLDLATGETGPSSLTVIDCLQGTTQFWISTSAILLADQVVSVLNECLGSHAELGYIRKVLNI